MGNHVTKRETSRVYETQPARPTRILVQAKSFMPPLASPTGGLEAAAPVKKELKVDVKSPGGRAQQVILERTRSLRNLHAPPASPVSTPHNDRQLQRAVQRHKTLQHIRVRGGSRTHFSFRTLPDTESMSYSTSAAHKLTPARWIELLQQEPYLVKPDGWANEYEWQQPIELSEMIQRLLQSTYCGRGAVRLDADAHDYIIRINKAKP